MQTDLQEAFEIRNNQSEMVNFLSVHGGQGRLYVGRNGAEHGHVKSNGD